MRTAKEVLDTKERVDSKSRGERFSVALQLKGMENTVALLDECWIIRSSKYLHGSPNWLGQQVKLFSTIFVLPTGPATQWDVHVWPNSGRKKVNDWQLYVAAADWAHVWCASKFSMRRLWRTRDYAWLLWPIIRQIATQSKPNARENVRKVCSLGWISAI